MKHGKKKAKGIVYIIHLDNPLSHAGHYIGYTDNLPARIQRHASGRGSPMLHAATVAGITWRVVRVLRGDKVLERELKSRHGARVFCPVCCSDPVDFGDDELPVPEGMICEGAVKQVKIEEDDTANSILLKTKNEFNYRCQHVLDTGN